MIPVTKPFFPPKKKFFKQIKEIYKSGYLTNRASKLQNLEKNLKSYFDANHVLLTSSGTMALQVAIRALDLEGEIITAPFSFIATTSAIVWEGCKPKFVDINPETLNLDENKIEESITKNTSAILATHIFGNPCNIERIRKIADKHNLKVIYDAAHCFSERYNGKSIFQYGDISVASFHATKSFHTIEGGAIFYNGDDEKTKEKIFGHHFHGIVNSKPNILGINGKMSEVHASMGLCVLPCMKKIIKKQKKISETYDRSLKTKKIRKQKVEKGENFCYNYYPLIFENEEQSKKIEKELNKNEIYPARYFKPSLNKMPFVKEESQMPNADSISKRVLCLPIYALLKKSQVKKICKIINRIQDKI